MLTVDHELRVSEKGRFRRARWLTAAHAARREMETAAATPPRAMTATDVVIMTKLADFPPGHRAAWLVPNRRQPLRGIRRGRDVQASWAAT
jgi:hypothetical protein